MGEKKLYSTQGHDPDHWSPRLVQFTSGTSFRGLIVASRAEHNGRAGQSHLHRIKAL